MHWRTQLVLMYAVQLASGLTLLKPIFNYSLPELFHANFSLTVSVLCWSLQAVVKFVCR